MASISTNADLLTREAAAKRLSISKRRLFDLTAQGLLGHVQIGRQVRYLPSEIDAFIVARTVKAKTA